MHAGLVGRDHLRTLAAVRHDKLLAVTGAASGRNVRVTDARLRICRGKELMWTAVAIYAGGGVAVATLHGFGMMAAIVGRLLIGMAGCTTDRLGGRFVRGAFNVGMAVHA